MTTQIPVLLYHQEIERAPRIFIRDGVLNTPFSLHGHDFFELELITSGSGRNWINNLCVPIQRGSLYLLSPSDVHRMEVDEPLTLQCVQFPPDVPETLGLPEIRSALFMQLDEEGFLETLAHCARLRKEESLGGALSLQCMSASLTLMLAQLLRRGEACAPAPASKRMQEALDYIQRHRTDPTLRLSDVARACGLSVCHFSATFHSVVGCSFSEYLTHVGFATPAHCSPAPLRRSRKSPTNLDFRRCRTSSASFARTIAAHRCNIAAAKPAHKRFPNALSQRHRQPFAAAKPRGFGLTFTAELPII